MYGAGDEYKGWYGCCRLEHRVIISHYPFISVTVGSQSCTFTFKISNVWCTSLATRRCYPNPNKYLPTRIWTKTWGNCGSCDWPQEEHFRGKTRHLFTFSLAINGKKVRIGFVQNLHFVNVGFPWQWLPEWKKEFFIRPGDSSLNRSICFLETNYLCPRYPQ